MAVEDETRFDFSSFGKPANADTTRTALDNGPPGGLNSSPLSLDEVARVTRAGRGPADGTVIGSPAAAEPPPDSAAPGDGAARGSSTGDDANSSPGEDPLVIEITGADSYVPLRNPLHDYPSYTYGISLHALSKDDYNQIIDSQTYVPKHVLIASAGRYNNTPGPEQFIRASKFKDDFYFQNLKINTVVSSTANSRNTNVVTIEFELIEPYGFSLIERIILTAKELGVPNYLEMAYLLQLDFFAHDNQGAVRGRLQDLAKYIPIRIQTLEVDFTNKGAEYKITATPYYHDAFRQVYVKTPTNIEVKAKTVFDFFKSDEESIAAVDRDRIRAEINTGPTGGANRNVNGSLSGDRPAFTGALNANSYGAAINAWNRTNVELNKAKTADVYKFVIDPEIGNASIVFDTKINHLDTGFTDIDDPQQISKMALGNSGAAVGLFDASRQVYAINSGTSIERVIDYVVRNSEYILKQLVVPESYDSMEAYAAALKANNGFLNWYKITAVTKMLDFCDVRGVFGKEITFYVNKYVIKNIPLDVAPQGLETRPVKVYNYLYTGKNDDILSCEIKFQTLYYNAQTTYRSALTKVHPVPERELNQDAANPDNYTGDNNLGSANSADLQPNMKQNMVGDMATRATGGAVYGAQVAATEVEKFIISGGDMITVELEIIGDPHFIKQDDIFYTAANKASGVTPAGSDPRLTSNGSLFTDNGVLYVQLNFQMPIDYNESNGLMKFATDTFQRGIFSGIYSVKAMESTFQSGVFKQTLSLARQFNQEETIRRGIKTTQEAENRNTDIRPDTAIVTPSTAVTEAPTSPAAPVDASTDEANSARLPTNATEAAAPETNSGLSQVAESAETRPITEQNEPATTPVISAPTPEKQSLQQDLAAEERATENARLQADTARIRVREAEIRLNNSQAVVDNSRATLATNPFSPGALETALPVVEENQRILQQARAEQAAALERVSAAEQRENALRQRVDQAR